MCAHKHPRARARTCARVDESTRGGGERADAQSTCNGVVDASAHASASTLPPTATLKHLLVGVLARWDWPADTSKGAGVPKRATCVRTPCSLPNL
eukprot:CAMPEP_0113721762 /NCGR_PEP_ID=MMETSP0038_2-20120614/37330_1 /TAXON_ID=2898 /ORGANISM="Cryptomonas paramecium" /LENGTH=94 /DNA_ID=CAMNT_0000650841 /DNA_START=390 /DNA_END=674 /DNA_ORIENTATION=+ /assembly_acc=CAM_ASM_000170